MAIEKNCTELSVPQYEELALARGLAGLVCAIISLVILVLMVKGLFKSKFTRGLLEWIVIYLAMLTIVDDVLFLVIMLPTLSEWFGFCRALGIGLELVNWVQQGCTIILSFHQLFLLYKLVQKVRNPYAAIMAQSEQTEKQGKAIKKCHYALLLLIWLPILLNVIWLPFEAEGDFLEPEPEWCWIVSITDDCEKDGLEFAEELIMWFIPIVIVTITVGSTAIATLIVWVYTTVKKRYQGVQIVNENYKPNNSITLTTYTLFTLLCLIELSVRTYTMIYRKHNYTMWMVFAVVTPFRDILLPVCYSVQVFLYKKQNRALLTPSQGNTAINTSMAHFQPD